MRDNARSGFDVLDDFLLAVVAVAAVLIGLRVLGWITGLVFFLVKVVVLAAVVVLVTRVVRRMRSDRVSPY